MLENIKIQITEMKTLQYELKVVGLIKDGHPYQEFASNEITASRRYDSLVASYPIYSVELYLIKKEKMRNSTPIAKLFKCPRGHTGKSDGKDIIKIGPYGNAKCPVCGADC